MPVRGGSGGKAFEEPEQEELVPSSSSALGVAGLLPVNVGSPAVRLPLSAGAHVRLPGAAVDHAEENGVADEEQSDAETGWWPMLRLALPATGTQLARTISVVLTYAVVGHQLAPDQLAGVSLGLSFGNMTLLTMAVGITMVLDTICTQEYGRDPRSPKQGLYLARSAVLLVVWSIPVAIGYQFCEPLLVWLLGNEIGREAAAFLRVSALSNLPLGLFFALQKFLAAQRKVAYPLFAQIATAAVLLPLVKYGAPFGVVGVGVALGVARTFGTASLLAAALYDPDVRQTLGRWSWRDIVFVPRSDPLLAHLPHSLYTCCTERWAFETLNVLAGLRGTLSVAAYSITQSVNNTVFSLGVGSYVASATTVGNMIGKNKPRDAAKAAWRSVQIISVASLLSVATLYAFSSPFAALFTNDEALQQRAAQLFKVSPFVLLGDNVAYNFQGVLRAASQMGSLATVVTVSQWVVTVPMAAVLSTVAHLDVEGVVIALITGLLIQVALCAWKVARIHWPGVCAEAEKRHQESSAPSISAQEEAVEPQSDEAA